MQTKKYNEGKHYTVSLSTVNCGYTPSPTLSWVSEHLQRPGSRLACASLPVLKMLDNHGTTWEALRGYVFYST